MMVLIFHINGILTIIYYAEIVEVSLSWQTRNLCCEILRVLLYSTNLY